ncbi:high mobility group B protein 10-like isoform X1 [Lycium ferocissimum]|uniref:high mobility group B protein 10-like isoform X1 n=1 Tax=Lycium ferocissimum TaxID=112874 RepID=UPI002815CC4A|nr:high mobility group B protein 10-like isoform X1 [Lycium ferocissimum]
MSNNAAPTPNEEQSQSQGYPTGPLSYPKPEAEYQEILQNSQLFWNKLQQFSASLSSNFQIPLVAGTPLDLHRLFIEVTSRGGIEKVIRDRKWGEVKGIFRFPSSVTNASFVLRKYYLSMLYHFEQVYYFRKEEPSVSAAGCFVSFSDPTDRNVSDSAAENDSAATDQCSVSYNPEAGNSLVGTIDAKFDYGYVITVKLGSENLNGVLYHTTALPQQFQKINTSAMPSQRIRKRRQLALKDPSRPKTNRSGYNFFFAEHYARLKPSYQGQERAISKRIGLLWSRLTEAEKQVYQEKGVRDKERYRAEMLEYKTSNAQPQ